MRKQHGPPAIVGLDLHVSARRWKHLGIVRTTLINQAILAGYALGVPVSTLARIYSRSRQEYVSDAGRS